MRSHHRPWLVKLTLVDTLKQTSWKGISFFPECSTTEEEQEQEEACGNKHTIMAWGLVGRVWLWIWGGTFFEKSNEMSPFFGTFFEKSSPNKPFFLTLYVLTQFHHNVTTTTTSTKISFLQFVIWGTFSKVISHTRLTHGETWRAFFFLFFSFKKKFFLIFF